MAYFLHISWSSDPQFRVAHYAGIFLIIHHNYSGVDQIVVPKSGGFREHLIKELHMTPLAGVINVWKLPHALFQRVWWPKLREIVTLFVCL